MEQRISLITLAVDDLPRAVEFYENMGWQVAQTGPGVAAFNMNGTVFGLYPWRHGTYYEYGVRSQSGDAPAHDSLATNVPRKEQRLPRF